MVPATLDQADWWAMLEAHPLATAFVGSDLRYRFVNRAYETWAMVKRRDIVGRTLEQVLGPVATRSMATYVQAALDGATLHYESSIPYRRLGTRRMKVTLAGAAGSAAGFFAFLDDVTAQHEAESAISAALEQLGDGYIAINNQYAFSYVNSGAARFYGLPREAMVGRKIEEVFPGSMDSPAGRMLMEVMETRVPQRRLMPSAGAPGRSFLMDIVPTTTGGVGVVIQDKTNTPASASLTEQLPVGLIAIVKPGDLPGAAT